MSEPITIRVPAIPVAQPRPRAVKFGNTARVHEVTHVKQADGSRKPHPINAFKATVRLAATAIYTGPPLTGPLRVDCLFVFPRHGNRIWKTKPMLRYWHVHKPDRDNLDKAVLDALKGTVLADDASVCDGRITKQCAAGDEQPHCVITIVVLGGDIDAAR